MKSLQVLIVVFLGMSVGFMSCGYGGTGGGGTPDCRAHCLKELDCCEVDPDCYMWDEEGMMAECLCECGNIQKMATFDYFQKMRQCDSGSCEALSSCLEAILPSCSGALSPGIEAYCNRFEECDPGSYTQCAQMFGQITNCYSQNLHNAMLSCSTVGTCETFAEDFDDCMSNKMGLADCNMVDY